MEWLVLPFKRYAEFTGRSRRREFWMFQLFNVVITLLIFVPATMIAPSTSNSQVRSGDAGFSASANFQTDFAGNPVSMALVSIYGVYVLAALVPGIALTVRRFHDQNKSGWWYLALAVPSLIPFLGLIPAFALLVFMIVPGTDGGNRYGPDPKKPYDDDVFA